MDNNNRFDLSDYLIHFFRDIDLSSNSSIIMPEHMGWQNISEGEFLPAFFMLRAVLRNGRLWATWSERNGKSTIYGLNPAICFTEMPIAAFLEAGLKRQRAGQAMSPFALVFPKEALFRLGARPVISGLSIGSSSYPTTVSEGYRTLPEKSLPINEQYRYVTYNLGERNIDWTHEREWRYPYRGDMYDYNQQLKKYGMIENWYDIPGLELTKSSLGVKGIGVIVNSQKQAELVISDILTLVDSGRALIDTFSFVLNSSLVLSKLVNLQDPFETSRALQESMMDLSPYFSITDKESRQYEEVFSKLAKEVENSAEMPMYGEVGGCWLWFHDNTHPCTRGLLKAGRIFVNKDGRYLAQLKEFNLSRDLKQLQNMTTRLSLKLESQFNIKSCYFSVLHSFISEQVPFYAGKHHDNISFYNTSWNISNR